MNRCDRISALAALSLLLSVSIAAQQAKAPADAQSKSDSVMTIMVAKITPASDTLWGADDPQSDEEWQQVVNAANDTIAAFESIRNGGTGPNDDEWARDAKWQSYTDEIVAAANGAINAARNRDFNALLAANDALYTPCEACHVDFNPGVSAED